MHVYVIGTILSIVISIIIDKIWGFKNKKVLKMFISLLPLSIISAFRYDVGWDYLNIYTNGFYMVGRYKVDWFGEVLFRYLIKILYYFFQDPLSLFITMSSLTALFYSLCYSEYSKESKPWFCILLYVLTRYYFCSLNIMRQALAILILLYATKYIYEKKLFKYILFVLLAAGFHKLSILYLPLYFFLSKNIKEKKVIFALIVTSPIIIVSLFLFISSTKYSNYFVSMFGNDGSICISELLISFTILALSISKYDIIKKDDRMLILFNLQLLTFITCLLSAFLPTADRIIWYFSANSLFLIPSLLNLYKRQKYRFIYSLIIIGALTSVFVIQMNDDSYAVLPYNNIIEHRK